MLFLNSLRFVSLTYLSATVLGLRIQETIREVKSTDQQTILNQAMFASSPPGEPLLADIFGSLRQCTIIGDYVRSLGAVSDRLVDSSKRTLILAPVNSAIMSLPQKPWKDGPENAQDPKVDVLRNDDRASKNIEAFVSRHIVPEYPISEGQSVKNLAGQSITVEMKDGEKYVNGEYKVLNEKNARNGAIWVISGVVKDESDRPRHDGL